MTYSATSSEPASQLITEQEEQENEYLICGRPGEFYKRLGFEQFDVTAKTDGTAPQASALPAEKAAADTQSSLGKTPGPGK